LFDTYQPVERIAASAPRATVRDGNVEPLGKRSHTDTDEVPASKSRPCPGFAYSMWIGRAAPRLAAQQPR
jgi:hypothetical protein